jgi:folate-binding protein YgfZ
MDSTAYETLVHDAGVISLTDWTQVLLAGRDRSSFLQNMCTNDLRKIEVGQACEAFLTDVKGKIVAHVMVIATPDHLHLLTVPSQAERIIMQLDRYVINADVTLTDISKQHVWHLVVGPHVSQVQANDAELIVPSDLLWPGGFLVRIANGVAKPFEGIEVHDAQSETFTALRVESRWPLFGVDFDDLHLPQEINRDSQAISLTKGCYLGQETIARIDALGHVNKKIVLVKFAGTIIPTFGSQLFKDGQAVGTISTSCWSPQFATPAALALVKRGANDLGTKLEHENGEGEIVAPITSPSRPLSKKHGGRG